MEGILSPQSASNATQPPAPTTPFEAYVIESLKHSQKFEVYAVKSFESLHANMNDVIENQQFMMDQMVTHDGLDEKLNTFEIKMDGKLDHLRDDLKSHTSIECAKVRDEMSALIKKCDGRTDDVVVMLERKKVITLAESRDMLRTSPFGT